MSVYIAPRFTGETYPMTNGRLCWDNTPGTVAASTSASGFPASNALPPRTDSAWRSTALPADWSVEYASAQPISFIGIAKHDLGALNATISLQYLIGATWSDFPGGASIQPETDDPILYLGPPLDVDGVRVLIQSADSAPTISVIMAGVADEWPQPFTWVGMPITEGDRIGFENTLSITGNWLGRTKVSDGLQFEVQMDYASEEWRQTNFQRFKRYANGENATFFIALRPLAYPEEVAYAWATDVVKASRTIANKSVSTSVAMTLQGLRPYNG